MRSSPFARVLALACFAGAAVMITEIAAPRLLARHLGTSVVVWAVTIATFFGGLAGGYAWGGRLADRGGSRLLARLLLAAAAAVALAIPLDLLAVEVLGPLPHVARVLTAIPLAFLPAAVLLGALSPPLVRAALAAGGGAGATVGGIGAAAALGSVAGAFLAGFLLLPFLSTPLVLLLVAVLLAASAFLARGLASGARSTSAAPTSGAPLRWTTLAALAGAAILALEWTIGRIASDRMGNSLFTWTSVVGVVLLGLAIGNRLGGRWADRVDPRRLLSRLLLASGLATAACLWTPALLKPLLEWSGVPWGLRTILAVAAAFLLPSAILGTLSPVAIRAALEDPATDGRIVGRLYAAGSVGAVAGALLASLVLVPLLSIEGFLLVLAILLVAAAGRMKGSFELPLLATLALLLLAARLPLDLAREVGGRLGLRHDAPGVHLEDSLYFRIRAEPTPTRSVRLAAPPKDRLRSHPLLVERAEWDEARGRLTWSGPMTVLEAAKLREMVTTPADEDAIDLLHERTRHRVMTLTLDKLVHGYADLDDPESLGYEYEEIYGALTRLLWPADQPPRGLFIGGGSYTLQRWFLARGGSAVTAEIDPAVTRVAREYLGLVADPRHEILHEDARTAVLSLPIDSGFRFAYGDAFDDLAVPFHLTTIEFARAVRARLAPDGAYLVNLVDSWSSGRFLGAMVRTLSAEFPHVAVFSAAPRIDTAQETFVVVASLRPLPPGPLPSSGPSPLPVTAYTSEDLSSLLARAAPPLLTDAHAPVEHLLAPVVSRRGPR